MLAGLISIVPHPCSVIRVLQSIYIVAVLAKAREQVPWQGGQYDGALPLGHLEQWEAGMEHLELGIPWGKHGTGLKGPDGPWGSQIFSLTSSSNVLTTAQWSKFTSASCC
jgi:hypothetical protein